MEKQKRVIIVGSGYAGMLCAIRLAGKARKLSPQITLINGSDEFIERPRLHEAATNIPVSRKPITDMLRGTGVEFIKGWVTAISPGHQTVTVNGGTLDYDYLVYAVGSRVDTDQIPGINEHAYVLHPYGDNSIEALRAKLLNYQSRDGKVVIVGGGATGIEGAGHIKSIYPHLDVTIVSAGEFADFKGERIQKHIRESFIQQDIRILEHRPVAEIQDQQLILADGESLAFDVCLWAGGFIAPTLAKESGLTCNERNQVWVDPCLHPKNHDNIYVIGDAMEPIEEPGAPARMCIMLAMVSGGHTADNLNRRMRGKAEKPMSFAYYGQGIAMGTRDAVGFGTYPADIAGRIVFRGKLAVRVRNFFVWLLGFYLNVERYVPGSFIWMGRGRYQAQQREQRQVKPASRPTL